jgi:hypothetical protein
VIFWDETRIGTYGYRHGLSRVDGILRRIDAIATKPNELLRNKTDVVFGKAYIQS